MFFVIKTAPNRIDAAICIWLFWTILIHPDAFVKSRTAYFDDLL